MAVSLETCVTQILCGLSTEVLSILAALLQTYIDACLAQIAVLEFTLLQLQLQLVPLNAAKALLDVTIAELRNSANIVPLNIITECTDLGDFVARANSVIDGFLAQADQLVLTINRKFSYQKYLNAAIAELNDSIDHFRAIQVSIRACGQL